MTDAESRIEEIAWKLDPTLPRVNVVPSLHGIAIDYPNQV